MSIAQNISVLCKRLTPLLAVLISSECTRAGSGIPVAGLLKGALRRISALCIKGLPRYWQFRLSLSAPEKAMVDMYRGPQHGALPVYQRFVQKTYPATGSADL